ncbi:MAG: hypothetical protein K6C14_07590 [Eubacterium sp.]|nr:hypothetical protein [Eubacterium sp.]
MKKITKLICVILAFIMAFSTSTVAFAKSKNVTPVIVLHGLGGSDIFQYMGTENEVQIPQFGLDVKAMAKNEAILNNVLKLFTEEQTPDYDELFDALGTYFKNTNLNFDKNGNRIKGQGIKTYWEEPLSKHRDYLTMRDFSIPVIARQCSDEIGAKNVYAFNYDWRVDMCKTADNLRKFIVAVKKKTGAKKVSICALSLGGAVMSAYLDKYKKKNDVERYILLNPAYLGADVARAFKFDLQTDKKKVLPYLKNMEQDFQGGDKETLFKAISAIGDDRIANGLDNLQKDVLNNKARRRQFYIKVLKPWIGNIPAFWEVIPYSQFDACVKKMVKIGYLDKSSGLYKKIKRYHKVQGRFKKNLKYVKKHGAQVAVIANYGTGGLPLTSKYSNHTDLLIDTKYASVGATVAPYGKKLKGKKAKGKYVSPDKVINAKTCLLPNNTFFIKGIIHGMYKYDSDAAKFITNLTVGNVDCNLKAVKKKYGYKQFVKGDKEQHLTNVG